MRKPDGSRTKMAETLVFLREFRSLTAGPAAHPGLQEIPAAGDWELFREFSGAFKEFLRSFGELRSVSCAPGAGRPAGTYPQDIHNLVYIREFGSLK